MSALPKFTMRELIEAGVHFGHKTMRWNPQMAPYIYGERNNIHIINLQKTVPHLYKALTVARDVASKNGRILFVSTKRQASPVIAAAAEKCGQYYVNHRWLGGMLTNWGTISKSIKTLRDTESTLADPDASFNKKERLQLTRQLNKLENSLGGIKDMGSVPDLIFVIDTNKENIAIKEANKLGIPVIAIADSNSSPAGIDHIIPGNDDAIRAITLYCDLISDAILSGMSDALGKSKKDAGASTKAPIKSKITSDKAPSKKAEVKVETKAKAGTKTEAKVETKTEDKPAAKKDEPKVSAEKKAPAKKAAAKKDDAPKKAAS